MSSNEEFSEATNLLNRIHPSLSYSDRSENEPILLLDYETLLTLGLEGSAREVVRKEKRKQKNYITISFALLVISIGIITTFSLTGYREYPEHEKLHSEIDSVETDINQLHSQINTIEANADIHVLRRDIEDKKKEINVIEHDEKLDEDKKGEMVHGVMVEIQELRKVINELQSTDNGTHLYN